MRQLVVVGDDKVELRVFVEQTTKGFSAWHEKNEESSDFIHRQTS